MATITRVTLQQVGHFIRHELKQRLRKDLRELRIVKEADIECASYFHLRRFLRRDDRWRVLARKHARRTGRYIDMLIFRKGIPRMAIEFKWWRYQISGKDRRSLVASLYRLRVNKAYFICCTPDRSRYQKLEKRPGEKFRLHECIVGLDWPTEKREQWNEQRKRFTRHMPLGRARRK